MRTIDRILIHCSASPNGRLTTAEDIDRWHHERDFRRRESARLKYNPHLRSIGYHFVIYCDGSLHSGRHVEEIGAHAALYNATSIGICMVGMDKFSFDQWLTLRAVVTALEADYPEAEILGHRDLPGVNKSCPGFDVTTWLNGDMVALPDKVLEVTA